MRNIQAAWIAIICLLGLATIAPALAQTGKSGALEVTYYYLPG
jgi:hypothetical protein